MKETNEEFHVIVSKRAAQMLVSHASFIAKVNVEAAERFMFSFEEVVNSLTRLPHRCPWLAGEFIPRNKYRYLIFERRYLIVYQIKDDTVYVDHIIDCRQDYEWLLR